MSDIEGKAVKGSSEVRAGLALWETNEFQSRKLKSEQRDQPPPKMSLTLPIINTPPRIPRLSSQTRTAAEINVLRRGDNSARCDSTFKSFRCPFGKE